MNTIQPITVVCVPASADKLTDVLLSLSKLACIGNYLETGESIYDCKVEALPPRA